MQHTTDLNLILSEVGMLFSLYFMLYGFTTCRALLETDDIILR